MKVHGIVLAGGKGIRFRPDKLLLPLEGCPIIKRVVDVLHPFCQDIVLVANNKEPFSFLNIPVLPDKETGYGPLMGIYSALVQASLNWSVVAAGDMPFIKPELIKLIIEMAATSNEAMAVVPEMDNILQPLIACYSKDIIPHMKSALEKHKQSVKKLLTGKSHVVIKEEWQKVDSMGMSFYSVNTQEEYEKAKTILLQQQKT